MKKTTPTLLILLALAVSHAEAGKIIGKVTFEDGPKAKQSSRNKAARVYEKLKNKTVVWVEGVQDFKVPEKRPKITQGGGQFHPPLLVVVAGQTVDMPNNDLITHNVYSKSSPKKFNLGIYPEGQSKSVKFDVPGLVKLRCSIHYPMRAKVRVVPNPFYYVFDPGAPYRILKLPAGEHRVSAWRDGFAKLTKTITMPQEGNVTLDFHLARAAKSAKKKKADKVPDEKAAEATDEQAAEATG